MCTVCVWGEAAVHAIFYMHWLAYLGVINIDGYTSPVQPFHEQLKHRSNIAFKLPNTTVHATSAVLPY